MVINMNVKELQTWVNSKIKERGYNIPNLKNDGIWGSLSRAAFIQVFVNKNAVAITDKQLLEVANLLGDSNTKRIKAVSKVESAGSGWFTSGLVKILYERHYFYRYTKIILQIANLGWIGNSASGGYTEDINKNNIQDSWEKLSYAVGKDPDAAIKSISIGSHQIMGAYYKELGYDRPIDMLWDFTNSEYAHYKGLANFILKVGKLQKQFLAISTRESDNIPFIAGYNGSNWKRVNPQYPARLANAMK